VSYGRREDGDVRALRVGHFSESGDAVVAGWGTVSDPAVGPQLAVQELAIEPPSAGHLVYYEGAGIGDAAGSLRRVQFSLDDLPVPEPPPDPPPDPPPEEPEDPGLASTLVREPLTFQLSDTSDRWIGHSVGVAFSDGALHIAFVDNAGGKAHISFETTAP
jgi:hypothetical protein